MRKRSILLLAGALAIVASLVVGPAATAGPERASAGTVVLIHDQEPPNLQANWTGNGLYATSLVLNNIWAGGGVRNSKAAYVPTLFTAMPKLVKKSGNDVTQWGFLHPPATNYISWYFQGTVWAFDGAYSD